MDDELPVLPERGGQTKSEEDSSQSLGPHLVERFMATFSSGGLGGADPFIEKLNTAQITQVLNQVETENQRGHQRQVLTTWMALGVTALIVLMIISLCWLFLSYQKGDLLREIIALLIGLGGGGTAGFGLGRITAKKSDA